MGRGRAKAKQTKVARELKYWTPDTDLRALERELHGSQASRSERDEHSEGSNSGWDDESDYDSWRSRRR